MATRTGDVRTLPLWEARTNALSTTALSTTAGKAFLGFRVLQSLPCATRGNLRGNSRRPRASGSVDGDSVRPTQVSRHGGPRN